MTLTIWTTMALDSVLLLVAMLHLLSNSVDAAKLRSWLGPDIFVEGDFPSARYRHGFTATEDNKTYVFSGADQADDFGEGWARGGTDGKMNWAGPFTRSVCKYVASCCVYASAGASLDLITRLLQHNLHTKFRFHPLGPLSSLGYASLALS